jgi:hypothetical protein
MKALYVGSNPLTILIRCLCGWKNYFDRAEWSRLRFLRCDNCLRCVDYNSLQVNDLQEVKGMYAFKETPERRAIVEGLTKLEKDAVDLSELIQAAGYEERAHKVRNLAQAASGQRTLITRDWQEEDANQAAA